MMTKLKCDSLSKFRQPEKFIPVHLGICCYNCRYWDAENIDGDGDAFCEKQDDPVNQYLLCGLFEDESGDRPREITEDLWNDYQLWRKGM